MNELSSTENERLLASYLLTTVPSELESRRNVSVERLSAAVRTDVRDELQLFLF